MHPAVLVSCQGKVTGPLVDFPEFLPVGLKVRETKLNTGQNVLV